MLLSAILLFPWFGVFAASGGGNLMTMEVDLSDGESLQRGARLFRNYCLSCHSAAYMRYSRMGEDLGLTDKVLLKNFIFDPTQKVGGTMMVAMEKKSAVRYFNAAPPDLSVTARSRGSDWLYTYFKTFYLDPKRPFGVNNLAFPNVGMPHVLWELQGEQVPIYEEMQIRNGGVQKKLVGIELSKPGLQSEQEYDRTVKDLVNFMVYLGEPVQLKRKKIGVWVMFYLFILLGILWMLKKEYWRDVH
ncbi:MAG: cytochrome c1 [Candidatus Eutrophobiaceae bacterium]